MIHRMLTMLTALAVVGATVVACQRDGWEPQRGAPSLPPAFGARVTDGRLHIWTGSPCTAATKVNLDFAPNKGRLQLSAPPGQTASVERLVLGGTYPGLEVTEALPEDFDWRDAESLRFWIVGHPGGLGSRTDIDEIVDSSARYPDDTYWFQDVGWLGPAEVAEQDGKTFLATCTPDPAE